MSNLEQSKAKLQQAVQDVKALKAQQNRNDLLEIADWMDERRKIEDARTTIAAITQRSSNIADERFAKARHGRLSNKSRYGRSAMKARDSEALDMQDIAAARFDAARGL